MKYYLYFIKSILKGFIYVGTTSDLEKRLARHNNGSTQSTKHYRPFKIIHFEIFNNKSEALKRELYFKSAKGYLEKKKIIDNIAG